MSIALTLVMAGCQVDPLSSAGLQPVDPAAPGNEVPPPPAPVAAPAPLEIPTTPPMSSGNLDVTGGPKPDPANPTAGGAPPAPTEVAEAPKPYDPVSRPQGQRTEGGAKFEGVSKRKTSRGVTTVDENNGGQ